jgi:phosphate-selective porin OprO/OprP
LTGEQPNVDRGILERQEILDLFDPDRGGWGAWQVAIRYSVFYADRKFFADDGLYPGWIALDSTTHVNGGYAWTAGLSWYPDPMARVMVNWVQSYAAKELVRGVSDATGSG